MNISSLANVCAILLIGCSQAFLFSSSDGPAWDGLRVTWNLNPFSSFAFTPMPRTTREAMQKGFKLKDNYCGSDTKFRGFRHWKDSDPGVILLFDKSGFIAGIQTAVPKDLYSPPQFTKDHPFVDDGDFWVLTAYFVDPEVICSSGRTDSEFAEQGTGDRLVLQNGTNALNDQLLIPSTQAEIEQTSWTKGRCFWTMGLHFWYNVSKSMSCEKFYPIFLMYNGGRLNAFGFAINAGLDSPRYEHPTVKQASHFIDPVPDCFHSDPSFAKLSTLHVYMIDSPRTSTRC